MWPAMEDPSIPFTYRVLFVEERIAQARIATLSSRERIGHPHLFSKTNVVTRHSAAKK
jgi:hypothetical protein